MGWKKLFGKGEEQAPDLDALTLDQLTKAGADLTQPRDLLHYLYLPTEATAEGAAAELRAAGYAAEAKAAAGAKPDDPNPWIVVANIEAIVDVDRIRQERGRFEALASAHGGDYDGWEASV